MLAVLAAILLVLDVGLRRLAVDPERVREALARATAKREKRGEASVAAWKRTRRAAKRRTSIGKETPEAGEEQPPSVQIVSGSDDAQTSQPSGDAETEPEDGDMASRLRAARRRARRKGFGEEES